MKFSKIIIKLGLIEKPFGNAKFETTVSSPLHVRVHRSFDVKNARNDIGMIYMKDAPESLIFDEHIKNVSLPVGHKDTDHLIGQTATVCGFGQTDVEILDISYDLKFSQMKVVDTIACSAYGNGFGHRSSLLCAQAHKGSVCGGDSGGPLTIELDGKTTQIGIVSATYLCTNEVPNSENFVIFLSFL
jgi:chymotrypsin